MTSYYVKGGHRLKGEVTVSGSKNAALGVISASVLLDGPCVIENVPMISDIVSLVEIIRDLGAEIEFKNGTLRIDPTTINTHIVTNTRAREIRASYYLWGAILGRFGKVQCFLPGGCNFGTRPFDLHIKGFNALGAKHSISYGKINFTVERCLTGNKIYMDKVSVGATMNLMIAATKAFGRTVIENAAREPHIVDTANFLNAMGAQIRGAGTDVIRVEGVSCLLANATYSIIPDQIEAGTFMIAAAITQGNVIVKNLIPKHMEPLTSKFKEMGIAVISGDDYCHIIADSEKKFHATSFMTLPYPGFPTDLQPQTVVLLTQAVGISRMFENVWDNRFQYVDYLQQMGAHIQIADRMALIEGPCQLTSSVVEAHDLRAGAAMVLAALIAKGETEIFKVSSIERGYENFVEKLQGLGADISIRNESEEAYFSQAGD